ATLTANIQAALDGFFGAGNTLASSTSATTYLIAFQNSLANVNLLALTVTSALTGTGAGVTNLTLNDGSGNEIETLTVAGATGNFTLAYNGISAPTINAPYTALAASDVQTNLNNISLLNGNVFVFGATAGPYNIVFRNALAGVN